MFYTDPSNCAKGRQESNVLSVKPELPRSTSHAHGTMESAERPEFPSGRQNITFNLLFVCRTCHSLAEDLESFHSSAKEVNEIFDIRVILGTAGGAFNPPPSKTKSAAALLAMFRRQLIQGATTEMQQGNSCRHVYVTLFVAPPCNLGSTPKLPPPPRCCSPLRCSKQM